MKKFKSIVAFLAILCVACIGALYFQMSEAGDMWPLDGEPGSLTSSITSLEQDIRRLEQEEKKIPSAREQLAAITADFEYAARVLPRESSPDQLIAAIRTKAQQAGVFPSSLRPSIIAGGGGRQGGARNAAGAFETWSFSMNLEGTYDQLATFVNRMEEFESTDAARTASEKRFFDVRSISIASAGNGMAVFDPANANSPVRHRCAMTMQTYRYTGE